MIYINQLGATELGRGETLEAAIANAKEWGFELTEDEIKRATETKMDGDVIWTDEPMDGYNATYVITDCRRLVRLSDGR